MKSIKSQKKKADAKSLKNQRSRFGDIDAIHKELSGYLSGMNSGLQKDYESAKTSTTAATEALKSRMMADSILNRDNAQSEQSRLGIQQAGMGSFNEDAAFSGQVADRSGADFLANLGLAQSSAGAVGALQSGMNKGQRTSAVGQSRNRYYDEIDANKTAYDDMVTEYKAQQKAKAAAAKAAAAYRRSQRSYGGGGYSRSYGGGGGYSNHVSHPSSSPKPKKKVTHNLKTTLNPFELFWGKGHKTKRDNTAFMFNTMAKNRNIPR